MKTKDRDIEKSKDREKLKEVGEKQEIKDLKGDKTVKAESFANLNRDTEEKGFRKTNEIIPKFYFPSKNLAEGISDTLMVNRILY